MVRALGDPDVGQAWLFVVTDAEGQHEGQYVYKVLKNVTQVARRRRFQVEIEVTNVLARAGLSVVPVVDSGVPEGGRPFMVTHYFSRGDLRAFSATNSFKNNLPLTLNFLERLTNIIKQVHQTAVHRDLKPENILIDEFGGPVLCDFGMCLPLWDSEDAVRNSGALEQVGSRHYMAPEAFGGFPSVENPLALDVYAIGKIAYELAAGRVLPGIEQPIGKYDLTVEHIGANDWYLFNAVIRGLVNHDPSMRMITWQKLSAVIEQARAVGKEGNETDPERFTVGVARALEESAEARDAKRVRDFHAKRETYSENLIRGVSDALLRDARIQGLRSLASADDRLKVEEGSTSSSDWVKRFPQIATDSSDEFRDGRPSPFVLVRLRVGKTPTDDPMPTLATDIIWRHDLQHLKLTFVLYLAKYGPLPAGGVIAASVPVPEIVSLDWAIVGDDTYIAQARLTATKMAARFAELVAQTLNPLASSGRS